MATNEQFTTFKLEPSSFTPQQVYKLGQTLESENKLAKAIACYRSVIKSQPDLAEVYFTLANLLLSQGKKEQALRVYRQGVNNNPRQVQYVFALASALAAQQKWVRASNNYQRAARIEPSAKIYYHWGVAQYQLKEYGEAKSHFEQAAQLKPSAAIYYYWGLTELQLQELGSAESLWQKAIDLQENHTPANYQLGKLWQNQRQWQKAISAYRKVIASAPDHAAALVNLGMIYRQLQQYSQAIACFRQGINCISPGSPLEESAFFGYERTLNEFPQATAENYLQLGKLRRARGYFPQAITAFIKSLQLDPYFKLTYNVLQYTLIAPEQYPQLTEVYRQIVAKHPKISIAWGNLGDALTQQDCLEEAIECYRKAGYQRAVQTNPPLAKLDWPAVKKHGPDFIIAGASKSGTSSIYYYLSRHPQVLLSHKKELDFYWQHYQRGVDWYLAHFPAITDRPDFLTGEASPNYLRFPQVAQRIKDTFPQTKIILLLRNPVDRAISWHYHKLNSGLTKLDLATAISTEIERLATLTETQVINTGYYNPDNIIGSLYFYQIKPWIEVLGREQFLILKSEDFYLDPSQVMDQVFKFLDLPSCPLDNYPKVNAGSYQEAEVNIRKTLQEYFAPYNQRLEEYLGMEFNWD
ncbi:MAG: tetratricopeptide repeat protein [Cyanobacteria bacterium P01_C01_bin.72]